VGGEQRVPTRSICYSFDRPFGDVHLEHTHLPLAVVCMNYNTGVRNNSILRNKRHQVWNLKTIATKAAAKGMITVLSHQSHLIILGHLSGCRGAKVMQSLRINGQQHPKC
jgi:hypothetical protein